jgi:pyruvate/2-oxoglutarate/acetoin dehydrogenase E1 component
VGDYTIPLGVAKIVRPGTHVTVVGWGGQMNVLKKVLKTKDICSKFLAFCNP